MIYAIAICIAVLAAYESLWFFCAFFIMALWLKYKRWTWRAQLMLFSIALCFYSYSLCQEAQRMRPIALPATWEMSANYKIAGDELRGFMRTAEGQTVYVVYTLRNEQEKEQLVAQSLAGFRIRVEGVLEAPRPPAHAYAFSMANYLRSKQAQGVATLTTFQIEATEQNPLSWLAAQRYNLARYIDAVFPQSLAPEAKALLIGLQDDVDEQLTRAYQKLGITHLFAISGLHVALLSWLFYEGLLRCRVRKELAQLLLLLILPTYAVLAGGAPSVWRAVLVVELFMLSRYLKWRLDIADALACTFIAYMVVQPSALFQIGLQLSYLATVSLIYSSSLLQRSASMWVQSFWMTVVCQLLVYPLLLLHFYELSLSSFLANVVFVPLFSFIILPLNVLLLALSFILPTAFEWLVMLYEPLRAALTTGIMWLQQWPYQLWIAGKPSFFFLCLFAVTACAALYGLEQRKHPIWIAAMLFIPPVLYEAVDVLQPSMRVTFLNVGQGDSILIELPHRRGHVLIDSGGLLRFQQEEWKQRAPYEVGTQVVVPYLKGRGIGTLHTMILTHADADHVEGADEVLREIRVRQLHISPNSFGEAAMDELREQLTRATVVSEQRAGQSWQLGATTFLYVSPQDTVYEGNNDSLVLYVEHDNVGFLFTGDMEAEGEAQLIRSYGGVIANLDVLKVAHHGSKTSSTAAFIQHVNPRAAVVMSGQNNRYKHPHEDVVARFLANGTALYNTAEHGTIVWTVRNGQLQWAH